jgi:hypothetical protein
MGAAGPERPFFRCSMLSQENSHRPWLALAALLIALGGVFEVQKTAVGGTLAFALAGLLLAVAFPKPGGRLDGDLPQPEPFAKWEPWAVFALIAAAAVSRFYALGSIPPGAQHHEGVMAYEIEKWMAHSYSPFVMNPDANWPSLVFYQGWEAARLFGWNAGSFRIPLVIWSLLSVPACYFLLRQMASAPAALVGSLFWVASTQHLMNARNFIPGAIIFFGALGAFALLLQGMRRGRWFYFVGAGFCAAMGFQGYIPGRTIMPLLFLWLGWIFLVSRADFPGWKGVAFILLGFFIGCGQVLWFGTFTQPGSLWGEYLRQANPNQGRGMLAYASTALEILPIYFRIFNLHGDPSASDNIPHMAMLDPVCQLLFPLGFFFCLARFWRPLPAFLISFLMAGLLPTLLSRGFAHPNFRRMMLVQPPVYLVVGLGFDALRRSLLAGGWKTASRVLVAAGLAGGIYSYAWGWDWYFNKYAAQKDTLVLRNVTSVRALELMKQHPGAEPYAGSAWPNWNGGTHAILPMDLLKRGVTSWDLVTLNPDKDALFLLDPMMLGCAGLLETAYPGTTLQPETIPNPVDSDAGTDYINHGYALLTGFVPKEKIRAFQGFFDLERGKIAGTSGPAMEAAFASGRGRLGAAFMAGPVGGEARFSFDSSRLSLRVNKRPVAANVWTAIPGGVNFVELSGRLPQLPVSLRIEQKGGATLESAALRPLAPRGMRGYFCNGQFGWAAKPVFERNELDPVVRLYYPAELASPFSIRYEALLTVPRSGSWSFALDRRCHARLLVKGRQVFNNLDPAKVASSPILLEKGAPVRFEADYDPGYSNESHTFSLHAMGPGETAMMPVNGAWLRPF